MEARDVAARMTTFMVLLYAVYMGALVIGGLGLYSGLIPGGGSFAMTIVPAIFGAAVIALVGRALSSCTPARAGCAAGSPRSAPASATPAA